MSISEMVTYSTVLIRSEYRDKTIGQGTGFIMNLCLRPETQEGIPVIITNKHVVRNSVVNVFEFCTQDSEGQPLDTKSFGIKYMEAPWINHPNADVDLCCLPVVPILGQIPPTVKIFYIPMGMDIIPSASVLEELTALEEIVMVGYPTGLSDIYNHKPIIRRGVTATHVKNNYQGKNDFLVDIACFPGSSGSPILILNQGGYITQKGIVAGNRVVLLGVLHSGPQYTRTGILTFANLPNMPTPVTEIPMNLGVAVKASEILAFESIFNAQQQGAVPNK
jgi:hypothetical protein